MISHSIHRLKVLKEKPFSTEDAYLPIDKFKKKPKETMVEDGTAIKIETN